MFSICTIKVRTGKLVFLNKKDPLSIRVLRLTGCGLTVFSSQLKKVKKKQKPSLRNYLFVSGNVVSLMDIDIVSEIPNWRNKRNAIREESLRA